MPDDDRNLPRIRELLTAQFALMASVLAGAVTPTAADPEYRRTHIELRLRVTGLTPPRACFCPWDSIGAWPHAYAAGTVDADEVLDELLRPYGDLLDPTEPPPWTLVYYQRGGNREDLPFDDFEASLTDDEFAVLDKSLTRELAARGMNVNGHIWSCGGGGRPEPKVHMFSIEEGAPSRRVLLRVFYVTGPGRRIALLRGHNKGRDDSKNGEAAAAKDACKMRADFEAQVAEPATREAALSAVR
jgi:hypothetical protein